MSIKTQYIIGCEICPYTVALWTVSKHEAIALAVDLGWRVIGRRVMICPVCMTPRMGG